MESLLTALVVSCLTCQLWTIGSFQTINTENTMASSTTSSSDATSSNVHSSDTNSAFNSTTTLPVETTSDININISDVTTLQSASVTTPTESLYTSHTTSVENTSVPMPTEVSHKNTTNGTTETAGTSSYWNATTANPNTSSLVTNSTTAPEHVSDGNTTITDFVPTTFSSISTTSTDNTTRTISTILPSSTKGTTINSTRSVVTTANDLTTITTINTTATNNGKDLIPLKKSNEGGVIIGAILGSILGVILVLLLAYIFCTRKKSVINHRRLYDNFPNDPVLTLNTEDAVDLRYQEGAAYYNPAAMNDASSYNGQSQGNVNYGIQMDDLPPVYGNVA